MTIYEAMFIFPDRFQEEDLEGVLKNVRGEVEALGGQVLSSTRLGRRQFARPMKKSEHGHYAVVTFTIDAAHLPALHARYKLNEEVLRVQIVRAPSPETVEG